MPHTKNVGQHHCPGLSGPVEGHPGPCRKNKDHWCVTHNKTCPVHPYWFYTMNLECIICLKAEIAEVRKEKEKRRRTADGEDEEEEEFRVETRKEMKNGKFKKVQVKVPVPRNRIPPNTIKKGKNTRRQKRIDIVAEVLPDLDLPENPLAGDAIVLQPLPTYEEWREKAASIVDSTSWKTLRATLIGEGVSDDKLPLISPEAGGRTVSGP